MQKKLIALAVAGLASTAAFAQSNVTVYGIADAYVGSFTASSNNQRSTGVNSGGLSGSRLGFKGAEDLGNGLKALFTLEYALTLDQNEGIGEATARQQFVGLSSSLGTAVLGRLQTPAYDWAVKYSALGGSAIDPLGNVAVRIGAGITSGDRVDNAVAYVSPSISGLTFKAAYTGGAAGVEANTTAARQGAALASADYDNGPLSVGLVYRNLNTVVGATQWGVGAAYDFKVAKLLATYQTNKAANVANSTDKIWSVTGLVPVTAAGAIALGYAKADRDANENGWKTYTVAYLHNLSKRTTVYGGYVKADSSADNTLAPAAQATASIGGVTSTAGNTATGLVAGIRHSF